MKSFFLYNRAWMVLSLVYLQSCTRVFSPIWYDINPIVMHELKDKGEWHAGVQFISADNGSGVSASVMHSPSKHLCVGGGVATLGNKGEIGTSGLRAKSGNVQLDLLGGGYFNTKMRFLSAQCLGGLAYGAGYSIIENSRQLTISHQRLYLQPGIFVHLPRSMTFDISYRVSQLYFTGARVVIGNLPAQDIETIRSIERSSPFRLGELGIGYNYNNLGPIKIGVKYTISSPLGAPSLSRLDYGCITTMLRMDMKALKRHRSTQNQGSQN